MGDLTDRQLAMVREWQRETAAKFEHSDAVVVGRRDFELLVKLIEAEATRQRSLPMGTVGPTPKSRRRGVYCSERGPDGEPVFWGFECKHCGHRFHNHTRGRDPAREAYRAHRENDCGALKGK